MKANLRGRGEEVPIHFVHPNPYNPNRQDEWTFNKQKHSLETFALSAPIVVRMSPLRTDLSVERTPHGSFYEGAIGDDYTYEIIDGEHRYRAAVELGWETITVWNLGIIGETDARQLTIIFNELGGSPEIDELALLLEELDEQIGRQTLVENMPFTDQQIEDLIETIHFSWENFEAEEGDEEENGEGRQMVRMEFRLEEHQASIVEQTLTKVSVREGLAATDSPEARAALLVALCKQVA